MRDPKSQISGHVTVNERIPSERFTRFVDEKMKDWVRDQEIAADAFDYEVSFFDEDSIDEVSCMALVQAGSHIWRSWETADNPRLALRRALEGMREETIVAQTTTEHDELAIEHTPQSPMNHGPAGPTVRL